MLLTLLHLRNDVQTRSDAKPEEGKLRPTDLRYLLVTHVWGLWRSTSPYILTTFFKMKP